MSYVRLWLHAGTRHVSKAHDKLACTVRTPHTPADSLRAAAAAMCRQRRVCATLRMPHAAANTGARGMHRAACAACALW